MLNGLLMDLLINTNSDLIASQVKGSLHHLSAPSMFPSEGEQWEAAELGTRLHLCVLRCFQALQASRGKPRATKGNPPKVAHSCRCVCNPYTTRADEEEVHHVGLARRSTALCSMFISEKLRVEANVC